MSMNKTTTSTNQYAPGAMANYSSWMSQLSPMLSQMMSNPFGSPSFNMNLQQQTKAASALGQRSLQNSMQSFGAQGLGTTGGAMQQLMSQMSRYGSNLQMQGYNNAFNQAQTNQWNAASLGSNVFGNPLVTGNTQVQKTSGLGTWLPQVLSGGLSALTGLADMGSSSGSNANTSFLPGASSTAGGGNFTPFPVGSALSYGAGGSSYGTASPTPSSLSPYAPTKF